MCIRDRSETDASAALTAKGFQVTKTTSYSSSVAEGYVISQTPNGDTKGKAVSYTHLDVYKRQAQHRSSGLSSTAIRIPECRHSAWTKVLIREISFEKKKWRSGRMRQVEVYLTALQRLEQNSA